MTTESSPRADWEWVPEPAESAPANDDAANRDAAFAFVRSLATELSRGRVDIPTDPDVANGVQQALGPQERDLSNTFVTRVISSDPGLAANVLALANGKTGARSGHPALDLKLAVSRVGRDRVRSAALPYVLEKLRSAHAHENIRSELARLWQHSTLVAAIARILATRTRATAPDMALLAGLLHNVGAVYVLARAGEHPALLRDARVRDSLAQEWNASIGKAVAQNWGLPEEIAEAIGDQQDVDRLDAGRRDLTDVLGVSVRIAEYLHRRDGLELAVTSAPQFLRLGLDAAALHGVLDAAGRDVAVLREALGH